MVREHILNTGTPYLFNAIHKLSAAIFVPAQTKILECLRSILFTIRAEVKVFPPPGQP